MKIVINARIIRTSTGRYVDRLLYYLQQVDTENEYVVILSESDFDWWWPTSPNFTKVPFQFRRYDVFSQFRMARLLYKQRADVVHFPFQPDVYTPIVGLLYFKKKIMTVHDLTQLRFKNRKRSWLAFTLLHYIFKVLLRLNVWTMRAVIVPTRFVRGDVRRYLLYPRRKIHVTYEAADISDAVIKPEPIKDLTHKDFLLYVGTAHSHKNLPRLADAFQILQASYPKLRLVLAGKKEPVFHDRLERYIKRKKIKGVILTGYVQDAELAWLYKNCLAYVFPSLSEGFGLPALEAMAYGAPVVSSNATCLPEVYGDAAHYFDPEDAAMMAVAIEEVLGDQQLRNKLINSGHEQVKKYSWEKMATQTLRIYESVGSK